MITKHLEIKTYNAYGIKVMVEINYDCKTISLLEGINQPKKWVFACRGLEYMNAWINILNSMQYAIEEAQKELAYYVKEKEQEKMDSTAAVFKKATDIVMDQARVEFNKKPVYENFMTPKTPKGMIQKKTVAAVKPMAPMKPRPIYKGGKLKK